MNVSKQYKIPFILFLVAYFMYLVMSNAPSGWAMWMVHKAVPGFWVGSSEGSMWSGKANSAQVMVGNEPLALGELTWELSPFSLIMMKPCIRISTSVPKQSMSGEVCQGLGGSIKLSDFTVDTPLSAARSFLPLTATGNVSIQISEAQIQDNWMIDKLDARYSWQSARVNFDGSWFTLGSFAGTAKESSTGGALAEIFDIEGPYKTALNGEWINLQAGWKVSGTLKPEAGANEMIVQGLETLGEDLGDGSYKVQWPL